MASISESFLMTDLSEEEESYIAHNIGAEWIALGRNLKLSATELQQMKLNSVNLIESVHTMIEKWKQRFKSDASKENMISTLRNIERNDIADDLEQKIPIDANLKELNEIAYKLKEKYRHLECVSPAPWIKSHLSMDETFTDVTLHLITNNRNETDRSIQLEEMFDPNMRNDKFKRRTSYMIVGDPGYGKSTLLRKIAFDWSNGKEYIANNFDIVMLIPLRDITDSMETNFINEPALLEYHNGIPMINRIQHRVLLLLDGYDELPEGENSKLHKLLSGDIYPNMSIILTSRSQHKKRPIPKFWNQLIKIKGFAKDDRIEILNQNNLTTELTNAIFERWDNNDLFACPLFLSFFMLKVNTTQYVTEFYKQLFNFVVKRNLVRENILNENATFDLFEIKKEPPVVFTWLYGMLLRKHYPVQTKPFITETHFFIFYQVILHLLKVPQISYLFVPLVVLASDDSSSLRNDCAFKCVKKQLFLQAVIIFGCKALFQTPEHLLLGWWMWVSLWFLLRPLSFSDVSLSACVNDPSTKYANLLLSFGKSALKKRNYHLQATAILDACYEDEEFLKLGFLIPCESQFDISKTDVKPVHDNFVRFSESLFLALAHVRDYELAVQLLPHYNRMTISSASYDSMGDQNKIVWINFVGSCTVLVIFGCCCVITVHLFQESVFPPMADYFESIFDEINNADIIMFPLKLGVLFSKMYVLKKLIYLCMSGFLGSVSYVSNFVEHYHYSSRPVLQLIIEMISPPFVCLRQRTCDLIRWLF